MRRCGTISGALTGEKGKQMMQMPMGQYRLRLFSSGGCEAAGGCAAGDCSGDRVQRADWLYRRGGSGADGIVSGRDIPAGSR